LKIKVIACEVFSREFWLAAGESPHVIDLKFLPFGLHDTPEELRVQIQQAIDETDADEYDYIVLGYGLCSRGAAEVRARDIPMVITKAHDCITLFLGSRARYSKEFSASPGTYYFSPGWIERKEGEMDQGGLEEVKQRMREERYAEYVEKYGEDNAQFLIEQESGWLANYTRAAFINMKIGDIESYREFTKKLADERGWDHAEIEGDNSLIRRLLNGDWDSDDFLKVPPGQSITESFDEFILKVAD